jgi:hypothetical protein
VTIAVADVSRKVFGIAGSSKSQKATRSAGACASHQSAVRSAAARKRASPDHRCASVQPRTPHACARAHVLSSAMPLCVYRRSMRPVAGSNEAD